MIAFAPIRRAAARLGETARRRLPLARRTPRLATLVEWAARIGYGARGFVYLSAGALNGINYKSRQIGCAKADIY